jgi:hypothetical protein
MVTLRAMGRRPILVLLAAMVALSATATSAMALTSFVTPSRSIGCIGDRTEVRCDIKVTTVTPPKRPKSCENEWGDAVRVRPTGRGRRVCHGDTALPAPGQKGVKVVAYGSSIRLGTITCTSRTTGLTCRNPDGHGFLLSREKIRVF